MPTLAKTGNKTQFRRGDGATPEVFTLVPEVTGELSVGEENGEIDVTNFDSDAVERIADLPDGIMVDITMNFINHAQQNLLIADVKARVNKNYQIYNPSWAKTYDVIMTPLGWTKKFAPKGSANSLTFKARISNGVTITG